MDEDFFNEPPKDKVVYPTVKLWHLFAFFAIALPLAYYFK